VKFVHIGLVSLLQLIGAMPIPQKEQARMLKKWKHSRKHFFKLKDVLKFSQAALLCAVIGSGIMGEQLAGGNIAVALLANTFATVFALYVLIETLGPISGAHFNPVVSLVLAYRKDLARHHLVGYVGAQLIGAVFGAWVANAMFDLEILQLSNKVRTGHAQWFAEVVATAGLLFVVLRSRGQSLDYRSLLHRCSLLVHGKYIVCESSSGLWTYVFKYIRWYCTK